jgi:3-oxoacyl-[acyl-carrier-protein] synthase II
MKKDKQIVITGLGVVSSIGIGWKDFWQALIAGKSSLSPITAFDISQFSTKIGGEVRDFKADDFIDVNRLKTMGRATQMAISAVKMAINDAGITTELIEKNRVGVCVGTTNGEGAIIESIIKKIDQNQLDEVDAKLVSMCHNNAIPFQISKEFGFTAPSVMIPTACAAGNYAIAYCCDTLLFDRADIMIAGGTDAMGLLTYTGFSRLSAVAPEKCQPFDLNRKGIIPAEGSAMIVLEPYEQAKKRNAPIYCELKGYGLSCDAFHMTAPSPEGVIRVIRQVLKYSGVQHDEISYINAHGTGTPANDKSECTAIKAVFGANYKKIPISSIKSMLGHAMGAASALEAVCTVLAVKNDIIPPTINYETPDPECDIDCVPNEARQLKVNFAINNSYAFGGNNASVVFGKI